MVGGQDEEPASAISTKLRQLADWIACAMFAAVFVIFNYKIFTRYFEHDEAVWADEVLVILFIWIIFWANAFLVPQGKRWFLFNERGQLVIAKLSPKGYEEIDRANILKPTGKAMGRTILWSHPAFANKSMYARNDAEIVCVSLAAE